MSGIFFSTILMMFGLLQALVLPFATAQESQAVKLRFASAVNGAAFACGKNYSNIGTAKSTITPSDFRFFVSEVELLTQEGKAVPLTLDQDGIWQYKNVALVDLEDGSGPCSNGTKAMHAEVSGSAPRGNYTGVRFTMGVPFELNHGDPTIAPSPLNITAMFWNWQGGYKFLKADMNSTGVTPKPAMQKMTMEHGAPAGRGDGEASGYSLHLGSTLCAASSQTESPSACKNPNRVSVTFDKFDLGKNVVVADLGVVLAGANVDHNTPNTSPGCMSFPKDADCPSVMAALGLAYDGVAAPGGQKFFSVK